MEGSASEEVWKLEYNDPINKNVGLDVLANLPEHIMTCKVSRW